MSFNILEREVRIGYCYTPYQRLWLYNGAPLVAFYDTRLRIVEQPQNFLNDDIKRSTRFPCLISVLETRLALIGRYRWNISTQKRKVCDVEFEFFGVLRHMQRYFSHICDGTDV